jgi:hypothetical protein
MAVQNPRLAIQEMLDSTAQSSAHMDDLRTYFEDHYFASFAHLYPPYLPEAMLRS